MYFCWLYLALATNYVVTYRSSTTRTRKSALAARYAATHRYEHAFSGFSAALSDAQAEQLRRDASITGVYADVAVSGGGDYFEPLAERAVHTGSWGLDRIDQAQLPLDARYRFLYNGTGVRAYVIDSGVRFSHVEFGARAHFGIDLVPEANGGARSGWDCHGHGTHVASLLLGGTVGVAPGAELVVARVLDCAMRGWMSNVTAAMDWVIANATQEPTSRALLSLSITADEPWPPFDSAVDAALAAGVGVVVSSGNERANACSRTPGSSNGVTVGATTRGDVRWSRSNYGACVEMLAPGVDVRGAWHSGNTAYATASGTSMAAPAAAGVAALIWQRAPACAFDEVRRRLTALAARGVVASVGGDSPNRLLQSELGRVPWNASCVLATSAPSLSPTRAPTSSPTALPTASPSVAPTSSPSASPSLAPTAAPSASPTRAPSNAPSHAPSHAPSLTPSAAPTSAPTQATSTAAAPSLAALTASAGKPTPTIVYILIAAFVGVVLCMVAGAMFFILLRRRGARRRPTTPLSLPLRRRRPPPLRVVAAHQQRRRAKKRKSRKNGQKQQQRQRRR